MNAIEKWIVEELHPVYNIWHTWGGYGRPYRFHSYHNARKDYEVYKKDFHYTPCSYRFCKIEIQPETILTTAVHSTVELDEDINLTLNAESQTMKFT